MNQQDQHYENLVKQLSIQNTSKLENIECIHFCKRCGQLGEKSISPHKNDNSIFISVYECKHCGDKEIEYKREVGITPKGKLMELQITNNNDLQRQVFKSKTSSLSIPEIELELCIGSLGACYCTIQWLVKQIFTNLKVNNPFAKSSNKQYQEIMKKNLQNLKEFYSGQKNFTLIIRDLVDSSFITSLAGEDHNLKITEFERTSDDNEDLGIDTMQTENY